MRTSLDVAREGGEDGEQNEPERGSENLPADVLKRNQAGDAREITKDGDLESDQKQDGCGDQRPGPELFERGVGVSGMSRCQKASEPRMHVATAQASAKRTT